MHQLWIQVNRIGAKISDKVRKETVEPTTNKKVSHARLNHDSGPPQHRLQSKKLYPVTFSGMSIMIFGLLAAYRLRGA
jgi:hypothetical protein